MARRRIPHAEQYTVRARRRIGWNDEAASVPGRVDEPEPRVPATLAAFAEAGVTRAILRLPSEAREQILPLLDQYAKLIR